MNQPQCFECEGEGWDYAADDDGADVTGGRLGGDEPLADRPDEFPREDFAALAGGL